MLRLTSVLIFFQLQAVCMQTFGRLEFLEYCKLCIDLHLDPKSTKRNKKFHVKFHHPLMSLYIETGTILISVSCVRTPINCLSPACIHQDTSPCSGSQVTIIFETAPPVGQFWIQTALRFTETVYLIQKKNGKNTPLKQHPCQKIKFAVV